MPEPPPRLPLTVRLVALLATLAGVVTALHQLGRYRWLQIDWSNLDQWLDDTPPEDALAAVARLLALVIAWWMLASTVAYTLAALARAPTTLRSSLRAVTLPGLRRLVDGLFALSVTATLTTTDTGAGQTVVAAQVAEPEPDRPTPREDLGHMRLKMAVYTAPAPLPDPTPGVDTWTVQAGDSLYSIADAHLGDPERWPEIWTLNKERLEAAGSIDPAVLHIDWVLELPPRSPPPAPAPTARADSTGRWVEVTVQPGDSIWHLAAERLATHLGRAPTNQEAGGYTTATIEANRDRLSDPTNPDLIYPGQQLVLPALAPISGSPTTPPPPPGPSPPIEDESKPTPTSAAEDDEEVTPDDGPAAPRPPDTRPETPTTTDTPPASPTTTGTDETVVPEPAQTSRAGLDEQDNPQSSPRFPLPGILGATGASAALAVGITRAVRRRRLRRNYRVPTTLPVTEVAEDVVRQLAADADTDSVDFLGAAIDDLAFRVAEAGHECRPVIVQHGADHVDVLLDRPESSAVVGWQAQAEGAIWSLPTDSPMEERRLMAAPLLVTLGQPDEGGQLYLDLEAAQVVTLTGDLDVAHDLAHTFAAELAHSPFAANAQITLLGELRTEITDLEGIDVRVGWDGAAADLTAWIDQSREALMANDWPHTFVARGHSADHDALIPFAVIATEPPSDPDVLDHLQAGPAAAAVIAIGDPVQGSLVIHCQQDRLSLPQLGLTCAPQVLTPNQVAKVADLMASADDLSGEELDLPLLLDLPFDDEDLSQSDEDSGDPADDTQYSDPPYEVLVRYLGDIAVEMAEDSRQPLTAKQTALVAYIAIHGSDGVAADRVADAVWVAPAAISPRKRLSNTITKCRVAIGTEHLPIIKDGRYSIGPDVITDLDLFEHRVKVAAELSAAQAVETLREALDLVTGPIFHYSTTDMDSYSWVSVDNWISTWELKLTAVAERFAELCLALDDPDQAAEVSERILRVVPTHPGLTEALMKAHAANGDRLAVKRVYEAHAAALEQLDLDTVAESTVTLYKRLRSG